QPQVTSDVRVVEAGPQEQRRGFDAAPGDHDSWRPDDDPVPAAGGGSLDTDGATVPDHHAAHPATSDDSRSVVVRVLQERDERGALPAKRTSVLAPSASLLATRCVARDVIPVIAECFAARLQSGIVFVGSAVADADVHSAFGEIETALELQPGDAFQPVNALPLVQHLRGSAQRVAPVDDCATAQA